MKGYSGEQLRVEIRVCNCSIYLANRREQLHDVL